MKTARTRVLLALLAPCLAALTGCCCDAESLPFTAPGAESAVDAGASEGDAQPDISTETVYVPGPGPVLSDVARGRTPAVVVEALRDLQSVLAAPDSDADRARFESLGWTAAWDPSRLGLDGVANAAGTVTVTGWAQTSNDVVEFTRRLRTSARFTDVTIARTTQSATGRTQDWTVTARLVPPETKPAAAEPAGMDMPDLLAGFNGRARLADVEVTDFKPAAPSERLGFSERRLSLGLRGGYVGTVTFFAGLAEVDPGLRIGDFSMVNKAGSRRGGGMLTERVELFAYAKIPAKPASTPP
jgi:hypothetical protein